MPNVEDYIEKISHESKKIKNKFFLIRWYKISSDSLCYDFNYTEMSILKHTQWIVILKGNNK